MVMNSNSKRDLFIVVGNKFLFLLLWVLYFAFGGLTSMPLSILFTFHVDVSLFFKNYPRIKVGERH
jgi:hypothetical protein